MSIGDDICLNPHVVIYPEVTIGDRTILHANCTIHERTEIGHGAIASARAGIHNDVNPGEIVSGSPAIPHKMYLKISTITQRLPDMYQFFRNNANK